MKQNKSELNQATGSLDHVFEYNYGLGLKTGPNNAVKFTDQGEVFVDGCYDAETRLIKIAIKDTGVGMTPSQLENLFQPFRQAESSTSRRFGGTGLGLAISKRLANKLGGDIKVESEYGLGSIFTLELPYHMVSDEQRAQLTPEFAVEHTPESKTILAVDDNPVNLRILTRLLQKAGYSTELAADGAEAVELAIQRLTEKAPFAVIFMDMNMPVMDGYEATRKLRAQGYTLPIIALTAHAMDEEKTRCLEAGCDDFATKPYESTKLMKLIAKHSKR